MSILLFRVINPLPWGGHSLFYISSIYVEAFPYTVDLGYIRLSLNWLKMPICTISIKLTIYYLIVLWKLKLLNLCILNI